MEDIYKSQEDKIVGITLPSGYVHFDCDDQNIINTLMVIASSNRGNIIAHVNSDSFSINWKELDREDEEKMAMVAYDPKSFGVKIKVPKDIDEKAVYTYYVMLGEDAMLGSYILTKMGVEKSIPELKRILLDRSDEDHLYGHLVNSSQEYFDFCINYGNSLAKKIPYGSTT